MKHPIITILVFLFIIAVSFVWYVNSNSKTIKSTPWENPTSVLQQQEQAKWKPAPPEPQNVLPFHDKG